MWRDGVVELDEDNDSEAPIGVEDAECGAKGVERLPDRDAPADRSRRALDMPRPTVYRLPSALFLLPLLLLHLKPANLAFGSGPFV